MGEIFQNHEMFTVSKISWFGKSSSTQITLLRFLIIHCTKNFLVGLVLLMEFDIFFYILYHSLCR